MPKSMQPHTTPRVRSLHPNPASSSSPSDSSNGSGMAWDAKHGEQPEPAPAFLSRLSPAAFRLLPIRVRPWGCNSCVKHHKLAVLSSAPSGSHRRVYPKVPYFFGGMAGPGQAWEGITSPPQTSSLALSISPHLIHLSLDSLHL